MIVGFTGTLQGMSKDQKEQLYFVLRWFLNTNTFHHGAARGADTEAEEVAEQLSYTIVRHPAGTDPLKRNRDIVDASDVLIAAPLNDKEALRSGTWATVRYARKVGMPIIFLSRGVE